ncbi:MAG TPA: PAS domain S-box protein [Opitutaceae bacterium]|nr:PAS domain S-box protein [Opitutaceae bacterium]
MTSPACTLPADLLPTWLPRAVDAHAIVAVTDAKGVIIYVNEAFTQISGYAENELLGKTHSILKSGAHPPTFYSDMWRQISSGKIWRGIFCNKAKGGHLYWVDSTIYPVPDADGQPAFYLALRSDVSASKKAEAAATALSEKLSAQARELRSSQEELGVFFTHAPIGISWREVDAEGRPGANHVNRKFTELIGLTAQEALDIENVRRATHSDDWLRQDELTAQVYSGKRDRFSMEKRYLHRDGRVVWGNLTVVVLRNSAGNVTHHFAMLEDITARRAAEEELRRSEARWRTYLSIASEILYALTPELTYKFVSPAWTSKLGHPVEGILGRSIFDFVHPEDAEVCRNYIKSVLEGGTGTTSVEYRMHHQDGRWIWHASTGSAYTDRDGKRSYFGVGRDISLRRTAQDELRAALARREEMERIVDRSPSVVVLWRAEQGSWPVEFVSQSIRQFGYTPDDLLSQRIRFIDITHPDDRERVAAEVAVHGESRHREYNQEYRIVCGDGSVRWVDDHTVIRQDNDGNVTHHEGLITDITQRKLAEDAERSAHERDLRVAHDVQQHLLPQEFPAIAELDIAAHYESSLTVGGDYYDVIAVGPRKWGFAIADVSGKGTAAALMMASCRATLRLLAPGEPDPGIVLRRVNASIQPDMPSGMYISLFYGVLDLDTRVLRYCRAGHEPPLLIKSGGVRTDLLEMGGLALGLCGSTIFDETLEMSEVILEPGDLLALYTDGINEACNANGVEFGRDRLAATLARDVRRPLPEMVAMLNRYLRQFSTLSTRTDDRTLLLVRMRETLLT